MVTNSNINFSRRNFLITTTSLLGSVGLGIFVMPFISSWLPSAQAAAVGGPIDIDVRSIQPGKKITVSWRGKPVFVLRRTELSLEKLNHIFSRLRDPESLLSEQPSYAKNIYRSIRKEFLVVIGVCTHLGCVPVYHPKEGELEPSWVGGFYCPCHGSKFDLAGRVYKGVPAPVNLVVPPYYFLNENILRIGENFKN